MRERHARAQRAANGRVLDPDRPATHDILDDNGAMPIEGSQFRRTLTRWSRPYSDKVIGFCHKSFHRYIYPMKSDFGRGENVPSRFVESTFRPARECGTGWLLSSTGQVGLLPMAGKEAKYELRAVCILTHNDD
jgi:hypothetical protein